MRSSKYCKKDKQKDRSSVMGETHTKAQLDVSSVRLTVTSVTRMVAEGGGDWKPYSLLVGV